MRLIRVTSLPLYIFSFPDRLFFDYAALLLCCSLSVCKCSCIRCCCRICCNRTQIISGRIKSLSIVVNLDPSVLADTGTGKLSAACNACYKSCICAAVGTKVNICICHINAVLFLYIYTAGRLYDHWCRGRGSFRCRCCLRCRCRYRCRSRLNNCYSSSSPLIKSASRKTENCSQ